SQTYEIEKFNRTKETIRSPITIEHEAETDRKMRETVLEVGDRYTTVEEITEEQLKYIEEIFDAVQTTLLHAEKESETKDQLSNEEIIFRLKEVLSTEITNNIEDVIFYRLIRIDTTARNHGKDIYLKNARNVLE